MNGWGLNNKNDFCINGNKKNNNLASINQSQKRIRIKSKTRQLINGLLKNNKLYKEKKIDGVIGLSLDKTIADYKNEIQKKLLESAILNNIEIQKEKIIKITNSYKNDEIYNEIILFQEAVFNYIENIGNTLISNYQTENFEDSLSNFKNELNLEINVGTLESINEIINFFGKNAIKDLKEYIISLKKLQKIDKERQDKQKKEILWSKKQKKEYETLVNNGFNSIVEDSVGLINFSSEENKNITLELLQNIGIDISKGENIIEKIKYYANKYNVYINFSQDISLNIIIQDLIYKIGIVNNILLTKKQQEILLNEDKLNLNKENYIEVEYLINETLKFSKPFLNKEELNELKEKLYDIYTKGLNSKNPREYWNNYVLLKKYNLELPYFCHVNEIEFKKALKNALDITRIELMQKNLIQRDYRGFIEIKNIIINQNLSEYNSLETYHEKRMFIINKLKDLYGINGDIYDHFIDIEKEYGGLIDEIIEKTIREKSEYEYGILDIFGNKHKLKETILKLIIVESLGNPFTHNSQLSSSALGILQKVEANYDRYRINPFNPKESIKSFIKNITDAFNINIQKKAKESCVDNRIKIAILIHYLGEGETRNLLFLIGKNIKNLYNKKYQNNELVIKAKIFLEKIDNSNQKINTFVELGKLNLNENTQKEQILNQKLNGLKEKYDIQ